MTTESQRARQIIGPVLAELKGAKRKEIRQALRAAYVTFDPAAKRCGNIYKIWCKEVAIAMRERSRRPRSHDKPIPDVMPSMRDWALEQGILEVAATFDVDQVNPQDPEPLENQIGHSKTWDDFTLQSNVAQAS